MLGHRQFYFLVMMACPALRGTGTISSLIWELWVWGVGGVDYIKHIVGLGF